MSVQGRDLLSGKPKQVKINHGEIAKALDKSVIRIEDAIMEALITNSLQSLQQTSTIQGYILAGGGALLKGAGQTTFSKNRPYPSMSPKNPLQAVVRGNRNCTEKY